jgi:Reverse transcriptase (RNA-dependent DNA polymerase)
MNSVFKRLLWKICLLYIDDLLIFSKIFKKHLEVLEKVFIRAREKNLKFRLLKCNWFLNKLEFLGYEISE